MMNAQECGAMALKATTAAETTCDPVLKAHCKDSAQQWSKLAATAEAQETLQKALYQFREGSARGVLGIFAKRGKRAEGTLQTIDFEAATFSDGMPTHQIVEGLEHGRALGWFGDATEDGVRLTEAGFAEIPDA